MNLNYSDPQDAESELAVLGAGSLNLAYEAEDVVGVAAAPASRLLQAPLRGQGGGGGGAQQGYRVKLGHDIYYCKPYQPFHTQLRYNFSGQWLNQSRKEMPGTGRNHLFLADSLLALVLDCNYFHCPVSMRLMCHQPHSP